MNYVYLSPFVLYTVSLGTYRGAMKRSARACVCYSQELVSSGFHIYTQIPAIHQMINPTILGLDCIDLN